MLLYADGLNGEWDGALGQNEVDDFRRHAPFAIQRLSETQVRAFGSREHERECHEANCPAEPLVDSDDEEEAGLITQHAADGSIDINSLGYADFRSRLVQNFDILHRQNKICWPRAASNNND